MKELVLTHQTATHCVIAKVDYDTNTVTAKRVPTDSPILHSLLNTDKIRKHKHELREDSDVWLLKMRAGWLTVSSEGIVSNTMDSTRLEGDDAGFLTSLVEVPAWSNKSKVFMAKLQHMGEKVSLRKNTPEVAKLSPEIASVFLSMSRRTTQGQEDYEGVTQVELWGRTLNTLYGSNTALLDPDYLSTLNWLRPTLSYDIVMWCGMTPTQDKSLYIYLKGDAVLYVGYNTLREADYNRYTAPRLLQEVLTYETLLAPTSEGLVEVAHDYLMQHIKRRIRVCGEVLSREAESTFIDFLESMLLVSVDWERLPDGSEVQNSWLYDLINDKMHLFKAHNSGHLGTYYGELTVEEWQERNRVEAE